ncbi:condensation domain-containing protein, partial [Microbispora sp. NPDC046973]|uniref:condensation domain-containing protein n=1 Tax=Microbispora sp. NPDC046973 TaxID=3155022 RepID=UPI0033D83885
MKTSRPEVGAQERAIEDIYPLTAMQQGMLLHTLLAPDSGIYWLQTGLLLEGDLDRDAFEQAWTLVFARHAALRGIVVWEDVPTPMWVVYRSVPLPLTLLDWSDRDEAAQDEALAELLAADRERGMGADRPSMARITLVRLGSRRHQLVWSRHHLALDGWSTPIVLNEFLEAYDAVVAGVAPALPARRPFRDHVAWAMGQDLGPAEAYWRDRLRGVETATTLQIEGETGLRGHDIRRRRLSHGTTSSLSAFARRHRLTVNTVVQGAWALLMSVYAGTDDVVYGSVTSGRGDHLTGVESMVGLLLNSIPARVRVDRTASVAAWLRTLQKDQVASRRFEHTPLTSIQSWAELPSGQSLFTSIFVFENFPGITGGGGGLRATENFAREHNNYPLTVAAFPGDELEIGMTYDLSRFTDATIERLLAHLEELIVAIVADGGRRVGELPLFPSVEQQIVREWNSTDAPVPAVAGVHELIAAQAVRHPDAVAVILDDDRLTYGELEARANQLAHHLRDRGVDREQVVGVCLHRHPDLLIALLAIWKAGAVYLPLDPDHPTDRLTYTLTDSHATLLLTHTTTGPTSGDGERNTNHGGSADGGGDWRDTGVPVITLDDPVTVQKLDALPTDPPDIPATGGQGAYLIYTSGSTGRPKGVLIPHHGLLNRITWMQNTYHLTPADRVLHKTPTTFDVSMWELTWPLTTGATMILAAPHRHGDPAYLADLIHHHHISVTHFVPSLLHHFAHHPWPTPLPTLRL